MATYSVIIKTITPYLQDRFSEQAKEGLKVKAGTKAKIDDDDSWKPLLYKDDKGIFIPQEQIRECLVNGGKEIKKKPFGSFKELVQSYFYITPVKIYLDKKEPDSIKESYPARKDGQRIKKLHPAFDPGLEIAFTLRVAGDDIDDKTVKLIIEKAGAIKGVGAWRSGGNGRFEIVEMKKV